MTERCPTAMSLSAWLDGELSSLETERVRNHVASCTPCRAEAFDWIRLTADLAPPSPRPAAMPGGAEHGGPAPRESCPDAEILCAYAEAVLDSTAAVQLESHLLQCSRCLEAVQQAVHFRALLGDEAARPYPSPVPGALRPDVAAKSAPAGMLMRWRRGSWAWMPASALAGAALLLVALQVGPFRPDAEVGMRALPAAARVQITADETPAYARPGTAEPVVVILPRAMVARRLRDVPGWVRVELSDGRRVWIQSAAVVPVAPE